MQAIIMAAGKGSRLGELTGGHPKSFLEIKGRKLIEYNLEILKKLGVTETVIVTGYRSEEFEKLLSGRKDIRIAYNPFYELMNVIGSFYFGMEYLHDDFLYLHADTLCDPTVFRKMLSSPSDVVLPVDYKECDDEAMKVRSESGRIVQITKKMTLDVAEGEFIGIAFFRKSVVPALKRKVIEVLQEKRFSEYFESAVQKLIDEHAFTVSAVPTDGAFWAEIDFREDYEHACSRIPAYMADGTYGF